MNDVAHRTAICPVRLSNGDYRRAHEAAHIAAEIWNKSVAWTRSEWAEVRNPSKYDIQKFITSLPSDERPLHAHTSEGIAHDLHDAIVTARTLRAKGIKTRSPWREKKYRPLSFSAHYGWRVSNGHPRLDAPKLRLSLGRGRAPIWVALPHFRDPTTNEPVTPERWGEAKLCWDSDNRQWGLHIAYSPPERLVGDPGVTAAIDEGIINPMAVAVARPDQATPAFDVLVVNGREARSIKRRRNKAVGAISSRLSRAQPGSKRHRRLIQAKKRAQGSTAKQLRDFDHQVTHKVASFIDHHDAGRVVVGDVRGIERYTNQKRRVSRSTRQQLSQWGRGRQERYLAHKTGRKIEHVNEAYTSQTCPACNTRNRPSGRKYTCTSCGFSSHRDAVGAVNIWRLAEYGAFKPLGDGVAIRVTYLRAVPRWSNDQRRAHGSSTVQRREARACSSAQNRADGTCSVVAETSDHSFAVASPEPTDRKVVAA